MRRFVVAAAGLAALLSALPATAAARRTCGPKSAHTEARNKTLRVYSRLGEYDTTHYYACLYGSSRSHKLDAVEDAGPSPSYSNFISEFALGGRYVAYGIGDCTGPNCDFRLKVRRIGGRVVTRKKRLSGEPTTVVVTADGVAAVLAEEFVGPDSSRDYVAKFDASGVTELDSGRNLNALSLSGRTLRWRAGFETREAEL